jgi:hypothetical protein
MNNPLLNDPNKMLQNLNVIFYSLIGGQIFYFVAGLFLLKSGQFQKLSEMSTIFMYIIPLINVVFILAAKFIYGKNLSKLDKDESIEKKSQSYLTNNIIKLALLESANLINITIMILTGNYFFAGFFVIITALYFLNKPAKEKFITEYQLSSDDVMKLIS